MDLRFDCDSSLCESNNYNRSVSVEICGAERRDILDHFKAEDIVDVFAMTELLDEMDKGEVLLYFGIKPEASDGN